ncbi:MAG: antibiotic biosynthesis monooxygenase [Planctomycetota bacterium]
MEIPAGSYAVLFSNVLREGTEGYAETADRMVELASRVEGFLGVESVRDPEGSGITISYWASREAIARWKADPEHLEAQRRGNAEWYASWRLTVVRVESSRELGD